MPTSGAGPNASLTQPMNSLAGVGGMLQGGHADLNKRGPVEFNHAISYVNKIKVWLLEIVSCITEVKTDFLY